MLFSLNPSALWLSSFWKVWGPRKQSIYYLCRGWGRWRGRLVWRAKTKQTNQNQTKPSEVKVKSLSHVRLFATPWTIAYQAPPFMGFSRQEYWSGLPFPSPGDLPDPGIEPRSPAFQADALTSESPGKPKPNQTKPQIEEGLKNMNPKSLY